MSSRSTFTAPIFNLTVQNEDQCVWKLLSKSQPDPTVNELAIQGRRQSVLLQLLSFSSRLSHFFSSLLLSLFVLSSSSKRSEPYPSKWVHSCGLNPHKILGYPPPRRETQTQQNTRCKNLHIQLFLKKEKNIQHVMKWWSYNLFLHENTSKTSYKA